MTFLAASYALTLICMWYCLAAVCSSNGGTLNPGRYVQERESGMCLSLTRNARGRNGLHLQQ